MQCIQQKDPMKLINLLFVLCLPLSLVATSAPAPGRPIAPYLLNLYDRMVKLIHQSPTITPYVRQLVEDAIRRLHTVGAPQGDALRSLMEERAAEEKKQEAAVALQPESEPAVQPAQPQTIPIVMSTLVRGRGEELNLADNEPLTHETYNEILQRQQEHGDPMIIARVVTYDKAGKMLIHYYDAYSFNVWRFGNNYPLKGKIGVVHPSNPINNLNISGDILYFSYDPNHPTRGFQLAFSETDFRNNPETRLVVDEYQNMSEARKKEARERRLGEWVSAPRSQVQEVLLPPMQPARARPAPAQPQAAIPQLTLPRGVPRNRRIGTLLASINRSTVAPDKRAAKTLSLGKIYYAGEGVPKNYALASQIFEHIQRERSGGYWQQAQELLGEIYYTGGFGVEQDYPRAARYFQSVIDNPDPANSWNALQKARFFLGTMYLYGHGVQRDVPRALGYWESVSAQGVDWVSQARAELSLGNYYLNLGDPESLRRAQNYFDKVLRHPLIPNDLPAEARYGLGLVYDKQQNYGHAVMYLEAAVNSNELSSAKLAQARYLLGNIFYNGGHGVIQDFGLARRYLAPIADRPDVKLLLGNIYMRGGPGVLQDFVFAWDYYNQIVTDPNANPQLRKQAEQNIADMEAAAVRTRERKVKAEEEEQRRLLAKRQLWGEEEEPSKRIKKEEPE